MAATRVSNKSIPLKEGMTGSACFKETRILNKTWKRPPEILKVHSEPPEIEISVKYIAHATIDSCRCSPEINVLVHQIGNGWNCFLDQTQ